MYVTKGRMSDIPSLLFLPFLVFLSWLVKIYLGILSNASDQLIWDLLSCCETYSWNQSFTSTKRKKVDTNVSL